MPIDSRTALIISPPGSLRDALRALLYALTAFRSIDVADYLGASDAGVTCRSPDLVLLDDRAIREPLVEALGRLRSTWPRARFLVLLEDADGRLQALDGGADAALMQGSLAGELATAIERLVC